jgi:uncharacterized membrane protein
MDEQQERNLREWENPDNWSTPAWFYFSKQDTRLWVPKRSVRLGWTVNLAHRRGAWILLLLMLYPVLVLVMVVLFLSSQIPAR